MSILLQFTLTLFLLTAVVAALVVIFSQPVPDTKEGDEPDEL